MSGNPTALTIALLSSLAATSRVRAQGIAVPAYVPEVGKCVIDSTLARRQAIGTLWLKPSTKLTDTSAKAVMERALVMEMQEVFVAPTPLDLWPWPGTGWAEGFEIGSLGGRLRVTIRDGQMTKHAWVMAPRGTTFSKPIELALERAASNGAFHDAIAGLPQASMELLLSFEVSARDTTLGVPLFRTRVPYLEFTTPARRKGGPAPDYPRGLALAGTSGQVDFEFVIGKLGRVVPGSIWVIDYTGREFVAPALKSIEESTYEPATVLGCPVGQMVQQRVSFQNR